jgi:hypothetical protein
MPNRGNYIVVADFEIQIEQSWEIMEFGETFDCETRQLYLPVLG